MWLPKTFSTSNRGISIALSADGILLFLIEEFEDFHRFDSTYCFAGDPRGRSSRQRSGYMNLRSCGDNFVFIPCTEASIANQSDLVGEKEWKYQVGYGLPYLGQYSDLGIFITKEQFDELHALAPDSLPQSQPMLTFSEGAKLCQLEAPLNALGLLSEPPCLNRSSLLTTSWESDDEIVEILATLIGRALTSSSPVVLTPTLEEDRVVTFFLEDDAAYTEWQPLAFAGGAWYLHLEPGFVLIMTST